MSAAPTISMLQQSARLRELIPVMKMSDGSPAATCFMQIDRADAEFLDGIAARLERMAMHEPAIRKLVKGR